jgi:hypothetical protein
MISPFACSLWECGLTSYSITHYPFSTSSFWNLSISFLTLVSSTLKANIQFTNSAWWITFFYEIRPEHQQLHKFHLTAVLQYISCGILKDSRA